MIRTFILLFCFPVFSFSQTEDTIQFFNYLKKENLKRESIHLHNILLSQKNKDQVFYDTLNLSKAILMSTENQKDSIFRLISMIKDPAEFNTSRQKKFIALSLENKIIDPVSELSRSAALKLSGQEKLDLETTLKMKSRTVLFRDSFELLSPEIKNIAIRYSSFREKQAWKAAVLSTIIPGLGKYYSGYKHQAASSFLLNSIFAAQAVESYLKTSVKHPRFIITTSIFSIFYFGNIYGTIKLTKKRKRDFYYQIEHEIDNYYNSYWLK